MITFSNYFNSSYVRKQFSVTSYFLHKKTICCSIYRLYLMRLTAYMRFLCHIYTQKTEFCEYKMFRKFSKGLKCWICAIAEYGQRFSDKKGKILRPRSIFQRWAAAAVKLVPSFLLLMHPCAAGLRPHVNSCQHTISYQLGKGRCAFAI